MSDMVELQCAAGHTWMRESKRGKRPKYCPDHQPEPEPVELGTRALHCEIGDHFWDAPRKRGRAPKNCPDHAPQPRVLWCERGQHDWERPSQKGQIPTSCPDHPAPQHVRPTKSSASLAKIIRSVIDRRTFPCNCGVTVFTTADELRELGGGCTSPQFVCPTVDSIRRQMGA